MILRSMAVACGTVLLAVAAQAATSDLAADFSNTSNPSGPWSFTQGGVALAKQTSCTPANAFSASLGNGFWGAGCDLNVNTPEIAKVTADGTASGQTTADWRAGDIVLHSTNPGSGAPLLINWTAPSDGVVDYVITAWYAHSAVTRSNDVLVTLNGTLLHDGVVTPGIDRDHALVFSGNALSLSAGDVLSVSFIASSGQPFGSLAGLNETLEFTAAVPEPATWAMMMLGAGLLSARARRAVRTLSPASAG